MKSLDEINQLLGEAEASLATLNARQAELLGQIAGLRQEKASMLPLQDIPLLPSGPLRVTSDKVTFDLAGYRWFAGGVGYNYRPGLESSHLIA